MGSAPSYLADLSTCDASSPLLLALLSAVGSTILNVAVPLLFPGASFVSVILMLGVWIVNAAQILAFTAGDWSLWAAGPGLAELTECVLQKELSEQLLIKLAFFSVNGLQFALYVRRINAAVAEDADGAQWQVRVVACVTLLVAGVGFLAAMVRFALMVGLYAAACWPFVWFPFAFAIVSLLCAIKLGVHEDDELLISQPLFAPMLFGARAIAPLLNLVKPNDAVVPRRPPEQPMQAVALTITGGQVDAAAAAAAAAAGSGVAATNETDSGRAQLPPVQVHLLHASTPSRVQTLLRAYLSLVYLLLPYMCLCGFYWWYAKSPYSYREAMGVRASDHASMEEFFTGKLNFIQRMRQIMI